jgi:serine/threonine-protein kinase
MIGEVIGGNYRILESVGQGGMGEVFRGLDLLLDRQVAIKVLHPELERSADVVDRFRREAVTVARLNHPNVATLYAFLKEAGRHFMIMEFAQGRTLDRLITEGERGLPHLQAVSIVTQVLNALACAHGLGIIHRDLKPSNIMVTESGAVKVMDFGIARVLGADPMTRTGFMVGTLKYMSPEQIRGMESDARSDLYSLGIVLFEMLTGSLPFRTPSDYEILKAHVELPPEPIRTYVDHVPPMLERAVMRALAKDPADRYPSAEAFLDELRQAVDADKTVLARRPPTPSDIGRTQLSEVAPKLPVGGSGRRRRLGLLVLCMTLVGAGVLLKHWQMPVSTEPAPRASPARQPAADERFPGLMTQAREALAAGRLSSPGANNAVDLAVQALRLQPEAAEAREVILQVAQRKLVAAEAALTAGNLDQARQLLATASELQRQFALSLDTVPLAGRIAAAHDAAAAGKPSPAEDSAGAKPAVKMRPIGRSRSSSEGGSREEALRRAEERRAEEAFVEERNLRELRQAKERTEAEARGPEALQRWEERVRAEEAAAEQAYHEERARRDGRRLPAPESGAASLQDASP